MKLQRVRNIGIAAHIDAGKTTVTERMLYYTGRLHRMGSVDEGTAAMDWKPQEQERGISIVSAATSCFWQNREDRQKAARRDTYQINIIDTPGHVDFTAEVERCMRVLDGVVIVFCGVGGVEPQSETVWHQADRYGVPRLCFVNKLDRAGSDMMRVVDQIRTALAANAVAVQIPFGREGEFTGVLDLIRREACLFQDETLGTTYRVLEVPEHARQEVEHWRQRLIETVAEEVDWLAEKFLAELPISAADIRRALREACIAGRLYPVLCGAALRNRGVQLLLDAICDYLPSPLDLPPARGTDPRTGRQVQRYPREDDPTSALAFKIQSDRHGDLYFLRVYSGVIRSRSRLYNANQDKMQHITRLWSVHAAQQEQIEQAGPGSIVAATGLKATVTGDTLCERKAPVVFERMVFPKTVISMAIEPKTQADRKKLDQALQALAREDPTFQVRVSQQTGQLLINGMGELHLEIIRDRLLREFGVDANVGEPRVSYRESIRSPVSVEETFDQEAGGRGQFARVRIHFEPARTEQPVEFASKVPPGELAVHFVRAVERALKESGSGALYGFPLINIKATLLGAQTHPVDSTELAFEAAAARALRKALEKGGAELLEPIMKLDIVTPEQYLGEVIAHVCTCRGEIREVKSRAQLRILQAQAPLTKLFGFASKLRSLTQGRGTFTMEPHEYRPAPPDALDFGR